MARPPQVFNAEALGRIDEGRVEKYGYIRMARPSFGLGVLAVILVIAGAVVWAAFNGFSLLELLAVWVGAVQWQN